MYAPYAVDASLTSLAASRDLLVGIGPLVAGIVVVALLILAVSYGIRVRRRGDQRPSSPGAPGPKNPRGYERNRRIPDEVPQDGKRRLPYEFKDFDSDTRPDEEHDQTPPKWDENSSGGFGSGGPGRT